MALGCAGNEAKGQAGPEGGSVVLRVGAGRLTIDVPPGALDRAVTLTARALPAGLPGAAGLPVELGPHGTVFSRPVALRFEVGPGDVAAGVPPSTLRVATRGADGGWAFLPTTFPGPRTVEGRTTHFSVFALVAPCRVAGVGTDFPLSGCAGLNPRVQTAAAVTANVTAGGRTVVFSLGPAPGATVGPTQVTVSGLAPRATYYLLSDTGTGSVPLPAGPTGEVRFSQDVSSRHQLVLMATHGTLSLDAATCAPPVGRWEAATATCFLTAAFTDPPLHVVQDGLTLDCLDGATGVRHVVGGAVRASLGVTVFGKSNVRLRNCTVENVDFGVLASQADGLSVENVTVRAPAGATDGTAAVLHGQGLSVTDFVADNLSSGLQTDDMAGLTVRRARFRTHSVAAHFFHVSNLLVEDVEVDGSLSDGLSTLPDGDVPLAAVVLDGLTGATVRRLTGTRLGGFQAGLAAVFDADASLSEATVSGARTALRLDGPAASEVRDSTLRDSRVGLALLGGTNRVFHNNLSGNSAWQVQAAGPAQLWDTRPGSATYQHGNSWGRACPGPLFVAGSDSNRADVTDAFPFGAASAWVSGATPGCTLLPPLLLAPADRSTIADAQPEIAGTATPGSTVEVRESGLVLAVVTASSSGAFSVRPPTPLADGPHTLAASARLGTSVSIPSAPLRFAVDVQPPAVPVIDTPPDGSRLNESPVVVGGSAEPEARVDVAEGAAVLARVEADGDGRFTATVPLPDGAHTLRATATDLAGNASPPSNGVTVTVARASPAAPLAGLAGKLLVTSVTDAPDPFIPARGDLNELRVEGLLQHSTGAQVGQQYFARIERVLRDSAGTPVRTIASESQLLVSTGVPTPVNASATWNGRLDSGAPAQPGSYASEATLLIRKGPRPGSSGVAPPDCRTTTSLSGPCVVDRVQLLTRVMLSKLSPETMPHLDSARARCATRLGVDATTVLQLRAVRAELPMTGQAFYSHKFASVETAQTCSVDLRPDGTELDPAALVDGEVAARRERYGALDPDVHAHLATLPPATIVPTVVFVDLPAQVPDFRLDAKPYDAKARFTPAITQPFVARLLAEHPGSGARALPAAFAVSARLPVAAVFSVARWPGVAHVSANMMGDLLAPPPAWYGTHRLASAHRFTEGAGARVGIVEFGAWTPTSTLPAVTVLQDGLSTFVRDVPHLQSVVSAVSNTAQFAAPGAAPRAQLFYAGAGSSGLEDFTKFQAIDLLLLQQVDAVNLSFGSGPRSDFDSSKAVHPPNPEGFGVYCDEQANDLGVTIVAGAGNDAHLSAEFEQVGSPANAINVIAVGMFDDRQSSDWEDDAVSRGGSWRNPPGYYGDRQKPDLVASGDGVYLVDTASGSGTGFVAGSSFATPIVTGAVALLNDVWRRSGHTGSLPVETTRAVLLASSLNNVDRVVTPRTRTVGFPFVHMSERDGAGGLDARAMMDMTVRSQFGFTRLWSCPAPHSRLALAGGRFTLSYGQRARAALVFSSRPTQLYTPTADLDLIVAQVEPTTGGVIRLAAWSGWSESTAEVVEFQAESAGTFQLFLGARSCTAAPGPRYVGYAWWVGP